MEGEAREGVLVHDGFGGAGADGHTVVALLAAHEQVEAPVLHLIFRVHHEVMHRLAPFRLCVGAVGHGYLGHKLPVHAVGIIAVVTLKAAPRGSSPAPRLLLLCAVPAKLFPRGVGFLRRVGGCLYDYLSHCLPVLRVLRAGIAEVGG